MTDNELLLAIADIMDRKLNARLKPIENVIFSMQDDISTMKDDILSTQNNVHKVKLFQENVILPRLDTIESCYTDTYGRYKNCADKMESAIVDTELLKKVVSEHSEKLQKIS